MRDMTHSHTHHVSLISATQLTHGITGGLNGYTYMCSQHTATLYHTTTQCNTLQHTIKHCNTHDHFTACIPRTSYPLCIICNTLQHTATDCNATNFNTMQLTATQFICSQLLHPAGPSPPPSSAVHTHTCTHTRTHTQIFMSPDMPFRITKPLYIHVYMLTRSKKHTNEQKCTNSHSQKHTCK